MRVAIYARFSSDIQSPTSIADQVRDCRAKADQLGGEVVEIYSDAALTGADARHRPALQRMLTDARSGRFDVVVSEALDRISRDQEDTAAIFKRLRFAGVSLVTISEGDVSELHVGLRGTMNALFLRDLAQKVRRGQRGRVEAGSNPGGICYGYRPAPRVGAGGEIIRGGRAIDPAEAEVVRRVFREFVAGSMPIEIAAGLNADRIPAPRGGVWRSTTIRGHGPRATGILRNPLYVGRFTWNRQTFHRDPETGRRVPRVTPPEARVVVDVPELAIVDQATWDAAAARIAAASVGAGVSRRPRSKHFLAGLIVCGLCGSPFVTHGEGKMRCRDYVLSRTCTNRKTIAVRDITRRALAGLRASLLDPAALRAAVAEFRAARASRRAEASQRAALRQREASELEARQRRLIELVETGGAGDLAATAARLREIEARLAELRQAEPDDPDVVDLAPTLPEAYRRAVDAFLAAEVPTAAARELRQLIERVEIHPEEGRGQYRAELVGTLAGLLRIENASGTVEGGRVVAAGRFAVAPLFRRVVI